MKYALIREGKFGASKLIGFTDTPMDKQNEYSRFYTVELKETNILDLEINATDLLVMTTPGINTWRGYITETP